MKRDAILNEIKELYFIHYFYVSVTDDAPKCPGAESPASSWPCAELSRRRVGGAESAAPSCPIPPIAPPGRLVQLA